MILKDYLPTTVIAIALLILAIYIVKTKNLHVLIGYNADFIKGNRNKVANKAAIFIVTAAILIAFLPIVEMISVVLIFIMLILIFVLLLVLILYLKKASK